MKEMELPVNGCILFAQLSLVLVWNVCSSLPTEIDAKLQHNNDIVIDILDVLNITRSPQWVTVTEGRDPGVTAWHFHSHTSQQTLPRNITLHLRSALQGSLGLHLVGRQASGAEATLISLHAAGRRKRLREPLLHLTSSTREGWLRLEFRSEKGLKTELLTLPGGNPFSGGGWVKMALSLEPRRVLLFVECREATLVELPAEGPTLSLDFPRDLTITFSSTAGNKASRFTGSWQTAELIPKAYQRRPWQCDNITEPTSRTVLPPPPKSVDSEERVAHVQPDYVSEMGFQRDAEYHWAPKEQKKKRRSLEDAVHRVSTILRRLKAQNEDLQARVQRLESCECVQKTVCMWEGREQQEGSRWAPDHQTMCSCTSGRVQCTTSNECNYEGRTYSNNEVFRPHPCSKCVCENGHAECQQVHCPTLSCTATFVPEGTCCSVCQSACDVDGRPYNGSFSTSDGCRTCSCQNGDLSCVDVQRCPQSCRDGVKPPFGSCCRDCSRCEFQGEILLDGVSYIDSHVPCKRCACNEGNVICSSMPCPTHDCNLLETVGGECCPRCRSCVHQGQRYQHGFQWQYPDNPCSVCICLEGHVQCNQQECNLPCRNPSSPEPGACCPVCDDCAIKGQNFRNGEQVPSDDQCEQCVCVSGNVQCERRPCPATSCSHPIMKAGDCCPRCEQCNFESEVYLDGQRFGSKTNPCLSCHCLAGEVVCGESTCSVFHCTHPAKQQGECCPTCDFCEYERKLYADGTVFHPQEASPCLMCTCEMGSVRCHEERCPPIHCANPTREPNICCPICKVCVLDGVKYEEGSVWVPGNDPCTTCSCQEGKVLCGTSACPRALCTHPNKEPGQCCESCHHCLFKHSVYENGQTFSDPDEPCQRCTCQDGSVHCAEVQCPTPPCLNTPSGQCCPQCTVSVCEVLGDVFVNGETFPNPVNPCEECVCREGQVDCHHECPRAHCHYPVSGSCCQNNCNGCNYAGKDYPNGMDFSHPTDKCRECHCINGNVQCLRKRCPPVPCSEPITEAGNCCPQCPVPPADCHFEGHSYRHAQHFYHPTDSCQSCSCTDGTVNCHRRPCPTALCIHPVQQDCCRTCDGCLYNGMEHANGAMFADISDPCGRCVCREGTVTCERRHCPQANCPHPNQGQCCQNCEGCNYVGVQYLNGQEFPDATDPCNQCVCTNGHVTCHRKPCYNPGCSHPVTVPGHCCPVCEGCLLDGVVLYNGQTLPDSSDPCNDCTCWAGSVQCVRRACVPAPCPHPVSGPCGCPVCEGCHFHGGDHADGEIFTAPNADCTECACTQKGEVKCSSKSCSRPTCHHPVTDLCGCQVCDGCNFHQRQCSNGERFPDPWDHCQHCTCQNGDVSCDSRSCPEVSCGSPVIPAGECCPVCTGVCEHLGERYESGSTFTSANDPCSSCICLNEVISCQKRQCAEWCTHPLRSTDCCPVCDACLYEGVQYTHMQTFTSQSDPCQQCVCMQGSVSCTPEICPPLSCHNAVVSPRRCCATCREPSGCVQHGIEYRDGQRWKAFTTPCTQCTCLAGEVMCVGSQCAKLSCIHQVIDPDSCCPRCRGCMNNGIEHQEGSKWFDPHGPCMSCMCVNGVTTCSEIQCLSTCLDQMTVPGECCPLCADCVYDGHVYEPGETFHPSDDPCQICICEVMSDRQQHLRCYRKQCPSLVDCPKHSILFSGPESCCPVCAQPFSNCTATLIGNEVLATDDPCFTCQCKDLTWTCTHKACLPLNCPPNKQYTPPDSCCPVCDVCVLEGGRGQMSNGESWTDSEDECITCSCNLGHIECNIEECVPIICQEGLVKVKSPGKCCYECQESSVQCVYDGKVYNANDHWELNECTSCTCVSGDVHCQTERCPAASCASDETPSLIPGMCCPHCIPRPATCIVFGDPHYRTFDGKMVNFQGACTYVLAQDCEGGDFSIHVTNNERGRKAVSWTEEVTVFIGDVVVQLLQDWVVKVDNQTVTLPFLKEPYVYLEQKTNTILLNTNIGMKVLWNGRSHLEVSVPGTYKKRMCGLCGNFNNYPQDDMRLRNGQISSSEAAFGNNWKVGSGNHSTGQCSDARNINPCKQAGYTARKTANSRCGMLKSSVFKPCYRVVPPEMFFAACVYDLCACASNVDDCLCDILEAYASECREAGVILDWRSPSLCAVGCPMDRGYVFDECGPPCPKTCFNKDVPLGVIEAHCFKPCVPGCQCPAGLVEHNAHCIAPEKCPKVIYGST
ncbi:kielin/chordin-like protein isoform X1 [Electrophorus electricus]|uniref:kielin/chordin-like protein isoform X1 n=1 Tax=Electrophorus electricus TaxID=8005 RepID=UPI0015CFC63A|nr:kielin/chordin-like protein isoform X1 [Electrophorus electricus]